MNPALVSPFPFRPDHPIARAPEPRFRRGTCDENVYRSVVEYNEYRLPDDMAGAAVVDIGGHIGSFTRACLERGAAVSSVFEPVSANVGMMVEHFSAFATRRSLNDLGAAFHFWQGAAAATCLVTAAPVWKWGGEQFVIPEFPWDAEAAELNTGGITLIPGWDSSLGATQVLSISIERVLREYSMAGVIDLLKIDAESAEWEILSVDTPLWSRVRRICGEYHADPAAGRTPEALRARLEMLGFQDIEIIPHAADPAGRLGLFFAGGSQAD